MFECIKYFNVIVLTVDIMIKSSLLNYKLQYNIIGNWYIISIQILRHSLENILITPMSISMTNIVMYIR